jgi:hypothetical protein
LKPTAAAVEKIRKRRERIDHSKFRFAVAV